MGASGRHKGANRNARITRATNLARARARSAAAGQLEELRITMEVVDPAVLADEPALAKTRYLKYHYMTPYQATEVLMRAYVAIWNRYSVRSIADLPLALWPDRDITAFWKARQAADAIGMPYQTYVRSAFVHLMNDSGKKRFPRPNQLYASVQWEKALKLWMEPIQRIIQSPFDDDWDPRFFAENHQGDPVQKSIAGFIEDRMVLRRRETTPVQLLGRLLDNVITAEEALEHFPPELVAEAQQFAATLDPREPRTPIKLTPYIPSCLGFGPVEGNKQCGECSFRVKCPEARDITKRRIARAFGTPDPRKSRKRKADRDRQQAYRRRKKEEKGTP